MKGVGKVTIENIIANAQDNCISFHDAIEHYLTYNKVPNAIVPRLMTVSHILKKSYRKCSSIIADVISLTGYKRDIEALHNEESQERVAIINEFIDMIHSVEINKSSETMAEIIDELALLSDAKGADKENLNAVKLMTAHASKGLEFNTVFLVGAEEGTFPSANAVNASKRVGNTAIEEERRLFYVAMTRAKKKLYITRSGSKKSKDCSGLVTLQASRFIKEIPYYLTERAF